MSHGPSQMTNVAIQFASEPFTTTVTKISVAMANLAALTLANICLDVQIGICMFLHPSDILSLRKVHPHQKFSLLKSVKYYYYQDL